MVTNCRRYNFMLPAAVLRGITVVSLPCTVTILFGKEEPRRHKNTKMDEAFVTLYTFVSLWFKNSLIARNVQKNSIKLRCVIYPGFTRGLSCTVDTVEH